MRLAPLSLGFLLATIALGCGGEPARTSSPARPLGHAARGGSVVIDPSLEVAYAADADNHALFRVDLLSTEAVRIPLKGAPEQVVLLGEDRLAVTLRDRSEVAILAIDAEGTLTEIAAAKVPTDPFGIALSPRGALLVTSAFANKVTALDVDTLEERWSVDVAREPRAVVVTPDGARAFVTHIVGDAVSVIDLDEPDKSSAASDDDDESKAPRSIHALGGLYRNRLDQAIGAGTLHKTAALAYAAVLSPSGERLFVPHAIEQNGASTTRFLPGAYGGVPVEEETSLASVAVVKTRDESALGDVRVGGAPKEALDKAAFIAQDPSVGFAVTPAAAPCRQARAATLLGDTLLVASQGTNELIALDARALDPAMSVVRRYPVGEGPKGVDVDPATRVAVVWSQLSHELALVALDSGAVERLPLASDPLPEDLAEGRRLFFTEQDRRISRDGRACAGCHPDGRDDGLVWKLGQGPRQTPMLAGRLGRGPYGWRALHTTLEGNMAETITRLGGTGLPEAELTKLAAFLRRGLPLPSRPARDTSPEQVARGRALFTSEAAGCSGCHHLETENSDRTLHDVGSRAASDTTATFRTPPLLFVGETGPYFHDGRYATLEQLLDDNLDRMGQTSHLSGAELKDLAAFLRSL